MTDDGERLARLETKFEEMDRKFEEVRKDVRWMRDTFMQARGARWIMAGLAGLGGFTASLLVKLLPFWKA